MKTNFLNFKSVFFILIIFGLVACKGEIGPPGADGVDGIDGVDGVDGEDGNANIISSDWFVPEWEEGSLYGISNQSDTIYIPELTQDVFDRGVTMVYWKNWNENVWQLPVQTIDSDFWFDFVINLGYVYLHYHNKTTTTPGIPSDTNLFRYVIIPPADTKSANSKEAILKELNDAGVDINNYYEVMDYYGLDY